MPTLRSILLVTALLVSHATFAQDTAYDWVGDIYPKNEGIDILNYAFDIQLTDNSERIQVVASIDARYESEGQNQLRLDLVQQSDELEGKGMTVDRVYTEEGELAYEHKDNQLFIDLGREADKGERIEVSVQYHGIPAIGLILGANKHGDFTVFSDNWSSKARNWLATVDHPYDKATSEFIVTAPDRMQVVSNGLLMEETDLGNGLRRTHWKNAIPISTWLFALGAAEFAVQYVDTFDGKSIQTWVYRQDRDAGFYDFAVPTKQALAYYTDLIGPFVYEKLANIQSNSVGGGMEAASSVFYGDRSVTGNRDRRWQHVIIHEIAHQWFGNAVTEYDWNHLWLSEGFATYYTLLFREYAYGVDDFKQGLRDARNRIIDHYNKDYDFQIIRDELPDLDDVSGGMIYQKGAWTLHMLREMMGTETYHDGVRAYYAEFINSTAHTGDFRRHMEDVSGLDLSKFFGQWLHQGGIPRLQGSWESDAATLTVHLEQVQPKYSFEIAVEFEVTLIDGSKELVVLQSNSRTPTTETFSFDQAITSVSIDPNTRLLAEWEFTER
ncbi:MAG: M1 family metallopeptidase [Rhodothermaceae bacterium]|nr:M1 family metallopeptidase [Rhodothermaceae bacterium]